MLNAMRELVSGGSLYCRRKKTSPEGEAVDYFGLL
jgi:hypothetical protein